jgi:hypothetical protein
MLGQQETLRHPVSQTLRYKIMGYLCKSRLAANTFPAMIQVFFDCLYGKKKQQSSYLLINILVNIYHFFMIVKVLQQIQNCKIKECGLFNG